jgi:A/G-specific adenine glycosylase
MWEFPNGRVSGDPAKELSKVLETGYKLKVRRKEALGLVKHAYTHFKVTVHVFRCELIEMSKEKNLKWVRVGALGNYPMGRVDRQISKKL